MTNILDPADEGKKRRRWNMPNYNAQCRLLAGGDWRAGHLLYRIVQVWFGMAKKGKKRLRRFGEKEWVAMSRADWARSAGLSASEMKNFARPALDKHCHEFLEFRSMRMKVGEPNMVWVHVNEEKMQECLACLEEGAAAHEVENYHDPAEQQKGIGYEIGVSEDEDA